MDTKLVFGAIRIILALGMTSTVFVNFAMASTNEGPRSDRACEEMVTLEGKQDARTEPDSPISDNPRGSEQAHEGSKKAARGCDLRTD